MEFDRKAFILNTLRTMSFGDIANATDMQLPGTDGWEQVADGVRTSLVDAYVHDNVDPDAVTSVAGELGEALVPPYERDRVAELAIIASAWDLLVNDPDEGVDIGDEPKKFVEVLGDVLGLAYENGIATLITYVEGLADEAQEEADDSDEDDEDDA